MTSSGTLKPLGSSIAKGALVRCWVSASVIGGVTPFAVSPPQTGGSSFNTAPSRSRCTELAWEMDASPFAPGKNKPVRTRKETVEIVEAPIFSIDHHEV